MQKSPDRLTAIPRVAFWGPWRDIIRNIWVIEWGMICCIAIIPLALIAGPMRHIPFWWTLIDMSFGVVGIVPLVVVRRLIKQVETGPRVLEGRTGVPV